jgi:hypothetical protein
MDDCCKYIKKYSWTASELLSSGLKIGRGSNCKKQYATKCYTGNSTGTQDGDQLRALMSTVANIVVPMNLLTIVETISSSRMTLFRGVGSFLDILSFLYPLEFLGMSHI